MTGEGLAGLIFFFVCLIISVGIYVYLGCTDEENKNHDYKNSKIYIKSSGISSVIWLIATSIFFIIGFIFDGWDYAWIVFLIGAAIKAMIELYLDYKIKD